VIGKGLGNVTMGEKRQEKVSSNPGPGEYDQDASKVLQSKMGSVRIGTAERKDIWID
jgi:hypothetical protein